MVKLLKPAPFLLVTLNVTGDHENRPAVDLGIHNTCHGVYHAGASYYQTYARPSREVPVGLRGIACALLVTEGYKPDSAGSAGLGDFDNRNANTKPRSLVTDMAEGDRKVLESAIRPDKRLWR